MALRFEKFVLPAADLGKDSPLPDINNDAYIRATVKITDNVGEKDRRYIGKGMIPTLLPYKVTNGYDRSRTERAFDAAVLENDCLKAIFVPELGGRLWSLYDKKAGRELLYNNEVFQPANLALRNAWFSGGVEWNVGIKGHNPLTCSPMFTQRAYNSRGDEILKMYEYERIRGVVYALYAALDGDVLYVRPCIENTRDEDVWMYWWSNIAVPQTATTRTIAPASSTFFCSYEDGGYILDHAPLPNVCGADITYAVNSQRSRDFFFDIEDGEDKWIAAVDDDDGLLEFSDRTLAGRKMFVWGSQSGGMHWNDWLSNGQGPYIEIQAGILKTQLEHFPMPGRSEISFVEGFCAVNVPHGSVHGDYARAVSEVSKAAHSRIGGIDEKLFDIVKEDKPTYYGSGWGALENKTAPRRISKHCLFPEDSMGNEQAEWLGLLDGKPLPDRPVTEALESFVVGKFWQEKLENNFTGNWYEYLQLGVIRYANGDADGAADCFERSIAAKENGWAYRDLAQIEGNIRGNVRKASDLMEKAADLLGDLPPLLAETAQAMMRADRHAAWVARYDALGKKMRDVGRLKMYTGACYVKLGEYEKAQRFINKDLVVADVREGEYSLGAVWKEMYAGILARERGCSPESIDAAEVEKLYPLPYELDFRMH